MDASMLEEDTLKDELAGTTAIAIVIKNNKLYCVSMDLRIITFSQFVCIL